MPASPHSTWQLPEGALDDTDAQARGVWPELEAIAEPARKRRRLPPEQRSAIIVRLCATTPLSVKELSELLDRSEAYIGDAIRPLVNDGQITFLYPDQPRHPKQKYLAPHPAPAAPAPAPAPASANAPVPEPIPAPARIPPPAPTAAPDPAHSHERRHHEKPAPFPNAWVNLAVVLVVGAVLGRSSAPSWFIVAIVTALALTATHVIANSVQYDRFRALHGSRNPLSFVLLKSGVALVEISFFYFVVNYFAGR